MLILALPSQTTDYWSMLEGHIERSLPPVASVPGVDVNQILYNLMIGSMQLWIFTDEKQETKGFVLTTTSLDVTDVRTLIIYMVVIFDATVSVDWEQELATLKEFALFRKCQRIAAFIANKKILARLQEYGANTSFTYATLDL